MNRRLAIILLLHGLLVSHAYASVLCQSQAPEDLACSTSDSAALQKNYGQYIQQSKDGLRIIAANGKAAFFARNDENSPNMAAPGAIAVIEPFNLILVFVGQWEGHEIHLVNYKHGARYQVDGWPLVSPDNQRLLIHSEAVESNYYPNQLSIYKVTDGYLHVEYMVDGDSASTYSWGPIDPSWKDARTIRFTKKWYAESGEMRRLITLVLNEDGWSNSGQPNKPFHATPDGARERRR